MDTETLKLIETRLNIDKQVIDEELKNLMNSNHNITVDDTVVLINSYCAIYGKYLYLTVKPAAIFTETLNKASQLLTIEQLNNIALESIETDDLQLLKTAIRFGANNYEKMEEHLKYSEDPKIKEYLDTLIK